MKILLTGASGLLGINLAQETMSAHEIFAVDRGKLVNAPFPTLRLDLIDPGAVDSALDSVQPDWVISRRPRSLREQPRPCSPPER